MNIDELIKEGYLVTKYDEDEILIFSGKFADKFVQDVSAAGEFSLQEELRNAAADAAERVMHEWRGSAEVPLPALLLGRMTEAAREAVITALQTRLGRVA